MPRQSIRSRVTRSCGIVIAVVITGAVLVGTGERTLARRTDTPTDPINPVSIVARTSLAELSDSGIPPNPVIPPTPVTQRVNRGAFVSAVAMPSDPVAPAP